MSQETPQNDENAVENQKSADVEEPPPGLYDCSPIQDGRRERKKVERLSAPPPKEKIFEIPEGRGTCLGDVPFIEHILAKEKSEVLRPLHKALFKTFGQAHLIKKNLRKFNGFAFSADSEEFARKTESFNKLVAAELKLLCKFLGLERSGTKDEIVGRLMDFLMEPTDDGKKVPQSKKSRRSSSKSGKRKKSKTAKKKDKKKRVKKSKESGDGSDDDDDSAESDKENAREEDEDDDITGASSESEEKEEEEGKEKAAGKKSEGASDSEDEQLPKKKPSKKSKGAGKKRTKSEASDSEGEEKEEEEQPKKRKKTEKKPTKKTASKTPSKSASKPASKPRPKKAAKPKEAEEEKKVSDADISSDSDDSDDEPLATKKKSFPSDSELKSVVETMLKDADLDAVTMKTVLKDVYDKFPEVDLSLKKDFLKKTVKSIIS